MSLVDLGKRLLEAAKKGDTEEVRSLMSNGAPFTTDWLGTSPLHFAAKNGHVPTAEVLLRAGISRDARTKVDRTPLHIAAQEGHTEIVELLLRNQADVEAKDMLKMTPLHWAVEKGHLQVVMSLMKRGSDTTCLNKFNMSPMDIGISNNRVDLVEMMQMQPAQLNQTLVDDGKYLVMAAEEAPSILETSGSTEVVTTTEIDQQSEVLSHIVQNKSNSVHPTDGSTDQSSTSVLATLAALAEATAPLNTSVTTNTTAAEALNWLETHGITMISSNDSESVVTTAIQEGQTITLTEAGKLALNFVKQQSLHGEEEEEQEPEVDSAIETVVGDAGSQKVIAIVTDQNQLPVNSSGGPMMVAMAAGDAGIAVEEVALTEEAEEPPSKKTKYVIDGQTIEITSSHTAAGSR